MNTFIPKSMNTRILTVLFCLMIAADMQAVQRSVSEAKTLAAQFAGKIFTRSSTSRAISGSKLTVAYTRTSVSGDASLYVFNRGNGAGYVIVSGDDRAMPVLGYSDSGTFDPDNMPDGMKYMLDEYAKEIQWVSAHKDAPSVTATVTDKYNTAVAPLLGDMAWNQSAPYNNMCPMRDGNRCVTGCVATSMAQIMRYHKWPAKGTGSHSYQWKDSTYSADFSLSTYDWDNMTPTYGDTSTETENAAVARLMSDCGVSVDMQYASVGSSNAMAFAIAVALEKYFNYNPTAEYVLRQFYSASDWDNMIKSELDARRPLELNGQSFNGGHSFVCDGYNQQGYFHINWGWGGVSNGYFLSTALDPNSQGIGGSTSGFYNDLGAVIGIETPEEQQNPVTPTAQISFCNVLKLASTSTAFTKDAPISVNIPAEAYQNTHKELFTGDLGVGLYDAQGNLKNTYTAFSHDTIMAYQGETKDTVVQVTVSECSDGSYELWPIYRIDGGTWVKMPYQMSNLPDLKITIAGDQVSVTDVAAPYNLSATAVSHTPLYANRIYYLTANISNTGEEYTGNVTMNLMDKNMQSLIQRKVYRFITLSDGENKTITLPSTDVIPSAGDYKLVLKDDVERILYQSDVTVKPEPTEIFKLSVDRNTLMQTATNLNVNTQLSNSGGYFLGDIVVYLFKKAEEVRLSRIAYKELSSFYIDKGEIMSANVDFDISALAPGDYKIKLCSDAMSDYISGKDSVVYFTIPDATGITNTTASGVQADNQVPYYTLQGVQTVAPTRKGIYIRKGKKLIIK
jgi:hypothetical protein